MSKSTRNISSLTRTKNEPFLIHVPQSFPSNSASLAGIIRLIDNFNFTPCLSLFIPLNCLITMQSSFFNVRLMLSWSDRPVKTASVSCWSCILQDSNTMSLSEVISTNISNFVWKNSSKSRKNMHKTSFYFRIFLIKRKHLFLNADYFHYRLNFYCKENKEKPNVLST